MKHKNFLIVEHNGKTMLVSNEEYSVTLCTMNILYESDSFKEISDYYIENYY